MCHLQCHRKAMQLRLFPPRPVQVDAGCICQRNKTRVHKWDVML